MYIWLMVVHIKTAFLGPVKIRLLVKRDPVLLCLWLILFCDLSGCDSVSGMVTRNAETNQGDGSITTAPPAQVDQQRSRTANTVFKSGPLFISSKGIGWTSWKKRWFILTRTSLVFFRSDPSVAQKGGEVNLTLGGIDLNNSGSVVVREDKKLLTVLFPDGRDGRAFTLKAETSDDLYEWKTALETALAQAPSPALVMGQNAIFRNDQADTVDGGFEQWGRDRQPVKSLVVGRPILLALEDIDGTPSFLEKALKFIEDYGVKVEGILRQAADVDDVEHRVKEYEQGKNEFSPEEDAHVIADCVKHVLRELPSSPVPASCCNALLEACRADRGGRINAMRAAISETFPEPNRRLLQRILKMMQTVASHKSENRMSSSAVAACMAPLLLRPLLAGDCELENDFTLGGDGSVQLLQAAAAANHAQAIVITLLEEYDNIFGDDNLLDGSSPEMYSETDESGTEDDEPSDDDEILQDDSYHDSQRDLDADTEEDPDDALSRTVSESSGDEEDDLYDNKISEGSSSDCGSPEVPLGSGDKQKSLKTSSGTQVSLSQHANVQSNGSLQNQNNNNSSAVHAGESPESLGEAPASPSLPLKSTDSSLLSPITNSANKSTGSVPVLRRPTVLGRTPAKKNLSMESIDYPVEEEVEIQRLEDTKTDLQNRIAKEAKENATLHKSLERRKEALRERRLALEQDVVRLQEQLQKERELRAAMEAGLTMPLGRLPISTNIDKKTKAELEEIALAEADVNNLKQKVADLREQLSKQREVSLCESCGQPQRKPNHQAGQKDQQKDVEATAAPPLHESSERSEDALHREDCEKVRTQETASFSKKPLSQKRQLDSASQDSKKSVGAAASSSVESLTGAPTTSNSKKSGPRIEAAVSTSSALSKLTTRLNFLKERRTQIVNELHNIDNNLGPDNQSLGAPPRTNSR
ncbi:Rho GTPase-activating protein domain [Macleaya cordata]|uniref:Rho GTPase-activating protein domain n=1 Tax=Macleaya cordata TaxID=56857 RepID=A0A200PUA7_MACCD|nr:Rho GTPase-activating protein domain [Macleaya cordata]